MAPKAPHEPEEGIIELFDIVDAAAEDAPKDELLASPHTDADAPEKAQADASRDESRGHVVSRYPFENGQDFLDGLDKTPVALPPHTDPEPPADAEKSAESPSESAAPKESDEALVRVFEEEMAKAGAASDDDGSFPPASSGDEETMPGDSFSMPGEDVAACDAMPEAETRPAPPLRLERYETPTECATFAAPAVEAPAEQAVPPAEPLPSAFSHAESVPAEIPPARADNGTEERITRLEEALSRLNERVSALEQRLDESGAAVPDEALLDLDAVRADKRALGDETRSLAAASAPEPENIPSPPAFPESETPTHAPDAVSSAPSGEAEEGPNTLALALEALHERVALLERRPVAAPDVAGIAQDVLALVRVDMEKAAEEQESVKRTLEEVRIRVQELEKRPLPQLILPDLPDEETIAATVMQHIRGDLDRIAAEAAARVLREEIAGLMRK